MYWDDHNPPHFHATYSEDEAQVSVFSGEVLRGDLPVRARRLVKDWAQTHRSEPEQNWELALANRPLLRIAPLR
jgi:hypothetical protein